MKLLRHLEELLGGALLLCVCGITLFNVASRYLFNQPLSWAEEAASILFVWLVMIGAALALKMRQHFAVTMLVDKLPGGSRAAAVHLGNALTLLAAVIILIYGTIYASWGLEAVTPSMELPRVWAYAAVPVGGALLSLRALQNLLADWRDLPNETEEEVPS